MRLVAWNCNGGMHRKLDALLGLRPDIAVLGECAAPSVEAAAPVYAATAAHAWTGDNPTRGLAVLAFAGWRVRPAGPNGRARLAMPLIVEGATELRLLALWTQGRGYVEEAHTALDDHGSMFREGPTLVAGDLNSNQVWDRAHAPNNHSRLVERLDELGVVSGYHALRGEAHGAETEPTFFQYRHEHRPFHLDYVFVPHTWRSRLRSVVVGSCVDWLRFSDHMPVVVDVDDGI